MILHWGSKVGNGVAMAGKADPWAGVDFDEIMDATCLETDDIKVLFNCFQLFDTKKQDYLLADDIDEVMR